MTGDGVDNGLTTKEAFGHFVFWAVSRHPENRFRDEEVFELIRAEYPHRLDESKWPDRFPRALQSIPQQRRYARLTPERLGVRSEHHGREVLRRIDEKVRLLNAAVEAKSEAEGLRFVTSRGNELPTTEDETGWQWFNLWASKLWPYSEVLTGSSLYWYDAIQKAIVWKTRVADALQFPYASKQEARARLLDWNHKDPADDPYFINAKDSGYCLAYRVIPVQRLLVPKPADFKFPQTGWLRATEPSAANWMTELSVAETQQEIEGRPKPHRQQNPLSPQARRLLAELVSRLGTIEPGTPQTYPRYSQIHDALGLEMHGEGFGISLKNQGLEEIALWIRGEQYPAITGIVVTDETSMPSPAYFRVYGQTPTSFAWWARQVEESIAFDWSPFLGDDEAEPASPQPTPVATDLAPPDRVPTTEYRILRDTELARKVKALHGYRCQVCGQTIELPDGTFYAEAHHIRPLGAPHDGHDVQENILCVCPNDHARLDLATIPLDPASLFLVDGHALGPEYIAYHNSLLKERWTQELPSSGAH